VVNKTAAANTTHKTSPDLVVPDKHAPVDVSVETDPPSINGTITPAAAAAAPNIDDTNTPPDTHEEHARENAQQHRGYNYGDNTTDTNNKKEEEEEEKGKVIIPHDDSNSIYVGLRVYTHKDVPALVVGRLKATKEVANKIENTSSSSGG